MNIPNRITLSRIFLIPIFILLLTLPINWGIWTMGTETLPIVDFVAALLFIIAAGTDWIDGYYARKYNLVTNLGKFLDPMADKLLVSAAYILLIEMGMVPAWIVIIIISREFAITGLRLVAAGEGLVLAAGNMGKWKTTFQLVSIATLLLHNFPFAYISFPFDIVTLYIALILTVLSGVDYFIKNWHVMKGSK
ncbi:CDP-diacylglycerol--glycerol-3-phosphate 3-phosphatidyltransferase [Paraliobacillus ryukyuensis]|uniref:CDP-diacylglycerol--glycerol-3-phosphate 3-phosphatidyltransferase n=1 Tax=Paraliobacillus ryukyuensis TaxID=200904 RepID=A0A366EGZ7_9BACI|nr:CDP-diacylglycerol--glycerol-3-phosphate 3-phosphatidyltransferase [Paraliobacillus ryukyuensis]RBP01731.1 CDP-diacylglycerol--glycerol-3-phosphate 3-phosphatidyltransferase [Paraliobacillus ryukyuensis]